MRHTHLLFNYLFVLSFFTFFLQQPLLCSQPRPAIPRRKDTFAATANLSPLVLSATVWACMVSIFVAFYGEKLMCCGLQLFNLLPVPLKADGSLKKFKRYLTNLLQQEQLEIAKRFAAQGCHFSVLGIYLLAHFPYGQL